MLPNNHTLNLPGTGNRTRPLAITPLLIGAAICYYLRQHFSNPHEIEFEEIENYTWSEAESRILIEMWTHFKPETAMHRPAIIVQRLDMKNMRLLFGGEQHQFTSITQPSLYSTFWEAHHAVHCIGTTGAETELLTSETYRFLHQLAPSIRKDLCLLRFMVESISEMKIIPEWKQNFVSTINIVSYFEDSWSLQEAPIYLNQLVIKTTDRG